jgi:hypothetical protein
MKHISGLLVADLPCTSCAAYGRKQRHIYAAQQVIAGLRRNSVLYPPARRKQGQEDENQYDSHHAYC